MRRILGNFKFKLARSVLAASVLFSSLTVNAGADGPNLIRDAEIEGLMRLYSRPIFKAAGINPSSVRVYLIADPSINAFVAGGQRIFIHTGLISRSPTPNAVIGVLAHESGHIAGGHLAKMNSVAQRASVEAIIGMLAGAAVMVGGAVSGNTDAARAGSGIMLGSQSSVGRGMLTYQRGMESTADQSALKYLNATGQSPKGMLDLFDLLSHEAIASLHGADPYAYSHPMPMERIQALEQSAKASPYFNKPDDPRLVLRHKLAQAKLSGFLQAPQIVFQQYPTSDTSLPARYARSIAMFRRGDLKNALPVIDSLTAELPQDPYFWELKAQAYLENGQADKGLPAIQKARQLLPDNGLLEVLNAQILLGSENPAHADAAIKLLQVAKGQEPDMPVIYKYMAQAYALKQDVPRAELASAEYAFATGDKKLALDKAKALQTQFKTGSPEWLRAQDLLTFAGRKN
jgi:predicted Zn-dependent protease